jgi:ribosome-associated heat shock protein Hsp15
MSGEPHDPERLRLDLFLWRARLFKTRGAAADAVEAGCRIERDGQVRRVDKPATSVTPGDLISFGGGHGARGGQRIVRILSLPGRRGPASEAALCYEAVGGASGRPGA